MSDDIKQMAVKCLKELGYSAYKISQETGLSPSIIGKWLSGQIEPSEANARYILLYYGNTPPHGQQTSDDKFMRFLGQRDVQYEIILNQNSEIIRQNGEILKRVMQYLDNKDDEAKK